MPCECKHKPGHTVESPCINVYICADSSEQRRLVAGTKGAAPAPLPVQLVESPHLLDLQRRCEGRPDEEEGHAAKLPQVRDDGAVVAVVKYLQCSDVVISASCAVATATWTGLTQKAEQPQLTSAIVAHGTGALAAAFAPKILSLVMRRQSIAVVPRSGPGIVTFEMPEPKGAELSPVQTRPSFHNDEHPQVLGCSYAGA